MLVIRSLRPEPLGRLLILHPICFSAEALAEHLGAGVWNQDYDLLLYDFAGHGERSDEVFVSYSDELDNLNAEIHATGLGAATEVLGFSIGANLALIYAANHPELRALYCDGLLFCIDQMTLRKSQMKLANVKRLAMKMPALCKPFLPKCWTEAEKNRLISSLRSMEKEDLEAILEASAWPYTAPLPDLDERLLAHSHFFFAERAYQSTWIQLIRRHYPGAKIEIWKNRSYLEAIAADPVAYYEKHICPEA
ncbi:MAG: alpha/beta hydrolase [Eubacteriales bacterium]|nr:alpha/beta hydrolase [Eubacteriales bacterium]